MDRRTSRRDITEILLKTAFNTIHLINQDRTRNGPFYLFCGARGRAVERRPRNLEVPSSIPGSGFQIWNVFIGLHVRREYWYSSQEAESREISISCKNLFSIDVK